MLDVMCRGSGPPFSQSPWESPRTAVPVYDFPSCDETVFSPFSNVLISAFQSFAAWNVCTAPSPEGMRLLRADPAVVANVTKRTTFFPGFSARQSVLTIIITFDIHKGLFTLDNVREFI